MNRERFPTTDAGESFLRGKKTNPQPGRAAGLEGWLLDAVDVGIGSDARSTGLATPRR